jgi:hypothetical protein
MERIGFERGMDVLLTSTIVLKEVVTDGHLEIGALMSKFYYSIGHCGYELVNCHELSGMKYWY